MPNETTDASIAFVTYHVNWATQPYLPPFAASRPLCLPIDSRSRISCILSYFDHAFIGYFSPLTSYHKRRIKRLIASMTLKEQIMCQKLFIHT